MRRPNVGSLSGLALSAVWAVLAASPSASACAAGPSGDASATRDANEGTIAGTIGKPLITHWTFDERDGPVLDHGGNEHHADFAGDRSAQASRTDGLHGRAMRFSGQHLLAVAPAGKPDFGAITRIGFSAWVRVARFDRYNEIFRKEDGDRRVLFSFQEDGRILSLGLNVNGYVECDAPIDPSRLLDGDWHHCAAAFDGRALYH